MAKTRPTRLTRDDWIEAATGQLIKRGVDAVRIEPLADVVGVSRGSFYWHFSSRSELLEAILEKWRDYQTRRIVERIGKDANLTPQERITRLRMLPARTKESAEAAALELAIRAWALRDKLARRVVDQVDAERTKFTASLLRAAGMDQADAAAWSKMSYAYTLGESLLRGHMTEREILDCRSRLLNVEMQSLKKPAAKARTKRA